MTTGMTTVGRLLGRYPPGTAASPGPRPRLTLQGLRPHAGWATFALTLGALLSVVWSVQAANWTRTPPLSLVGIFGFLTGVALAKLRLNALTLQVVATAAGLLTFVLFFMRFLDTPPGFEGVRVVGERIGTWIYAARTGGISTDELPFAVVLVGATWALGYLVGWLTFRRRQVWIPLVVAGLGLLTNLSYLPGRFISYFYLFLLFSMLLLAWVSFLQRREQWNRQQIRHSAVVGARNMNNALWFGVALLVVATVLPGLSRPPGFNRVYEAIRWPAETFGGDFNRLFAGVPAQKPPPFRIFDSTLAFQGHLTLGEQVVFAADSSRPTYWKVRSYPTYVSQGWTSENTELVPVDWRQYETAGAQYEKRENVLQEITLQYSPDRLPFGGTVAQSDLRLQGEVPVPPTYRLNLSPVLDLPQMSLPEDLSRLGAGLRQASLSSVEEADVGPDDQVVGDSIGPEGQRRAVVYRPPTRSQIENRLPADLELVGVDRDELDHITAIQVRHVVEEPLDILSVKTTDRLASEESYTVKTSVSVATPRELRAAGEDYPAWVEDLYLQLPESLPQRVRDLAADVAGDNQTPYDKATAIQQYLKTIPYSLYIPAPPPNADGVDHFLFTARKGYSEYYGSAMAIMLRSVGVPARLAVGYGLGEVTSEGQVLVRDRNAHGWTEVYFPGYGWVDFEPTPGQTLPTGDELVRAGSGSVETQEDDGVVPTTEEGDELFLPPVGVGGSEDDGFMVPIGMPGWPTIAVGGSAAVVGLVLWLVIRWLVATPGEVVGVYRKMRRLTALAGIGHTESQTAREYADAVAQRQPDLGRQVVFVVEAYGRRLYGNRLLHEDHQRAVLDTWREMRFTLLRLASGRLVPWRSTSSPLGQH